MLALAPSFTSVFFLPTIETLASICMENPKSSLENAGLNCLPLEIGTEDSGLLSSPANQVTRAADSFGGHDLDVIVDAGDQTRLMPGALRTTIIQNISHSFSYLPTLRASLPSPSLSMSTTNIALGTRVLHWPALQKKASSFYTVGSRQGGPHLLYKSIGKTLGLERFNWLCLDLFFLSSVCMSAVSSHLTGLCLKHIPVMERDSENLWGEKLSSLSVLNQSCDIQITLFLWPVSLPALFQMNQCKYAMRMFFLLEEKSSKYEIWPVSLRTQELGTGVLGSREVTAPAF